MVRSRCVPLAFVAVAGTVLAACHQAHVADPAGQDYVRVESGELLAACQLNPAVEFTGSAGIAGGTLAGAGVAITIPAGALSTATSFHVRIPSSPYAEVEIHADGQEHYQFMQPVVIAIDYSRCGTPSGDLTAWHIDPETKALLEDMGGVNDVLNQRVIFSTMHLSGYAIAN
jgi:hypothetical protein